MRTVDAAADPAPVTRTATARRSTIVELEPRQWRAHWVGLTGEPLPAGSYAWFRTEVHVDDPSGHVLHLGADSRYRLWVNGAHVADGPVPSRPGQAYADRHDLATVLRPGRNVVAVAVHDVGQGFGGGPALISELDGASGPVAATGEAGWQVRRADAWATPTFAMPFNLFDPYQEVFDARREPAGWREPGFDDADWTAAAPVGTQDDGRDLPAPAPRPVPPVVEAVRRFVRVAGVEECLWLRNRTRPDLSITLSQAGRPVRYATADHLEGLLAGGDQRQPAVLACSDEHLRDPTFDGVYDPCVLLDLGRVEAAYVELDVEGPAGATLDVGVAERLVDGHFNNAIEGQFASRLVLRGGRQTFRTFAWRGFRYARVRLTEGSGTVRVHALHAVTTAYPFDEVGRFTSDDPQLDRLVEICRHTVRLCGHASIMDTPWREQAQWLGDVAAVTIPVLRACFGDPQLIEKFFREAAATQQDTTGTLASISNGPTGDRDIDIVDYNLWWTIALRDQYRYTGDLQLVRDLFPTVRRLLDGVLRHRSDRGLVRGFGWVFIDWADVDVSAEPASLNAILHGALHAGTELATAVDAPGEADRWRAAASALRAAFVPAYWDPERQVLVDAGEEGWRSTAVSEHTNFAAIRFGLVEGEQAHGIVDRLLVRREVACTEAQPFFASVVLDGLYRVGRVDLALEVVRARWGARFVDRGYASTPEEWGINGSWRTGAFDGFLRTLSHAWSAYPAAFLIQRLAGIEVLEPGCRAVRVAPTIVDADYEVVFPTPRGPIEVAVRGGDVSVTAPDGVHVVRGTPPLSG